MSLNLSGQMLPARPRILFMGTPEFAVPTLGGLIRNGHRVIAVVTQPDRPRGRGKKTGISPVKAFAPGKDLEVLQPERASDPGFCDLVREKKPDLIIVVAFGQILRKNLLEIPTWGVLNVHASLLPAYRGAAPIEWAILNNESETGLTVMRMDEGLDTGPILFQESVPIGDEETGGDLHDRLAHLAGDLMVRSLSHMAENPIRELDQDHSRATYAPKIDRKICLIDWHESAARVSARIRALDPKPGAFTTASGNEIKMFSPRVIGEARPLAVPGRVVKTGKALVVETGEGAVEISEVQLSSKKRVSTGDFLRGFSLPEGTVLGQ